MIAFKSPRFRSFVASLTVFIFTSTSFTYAAPMTAGEVSLSGVSNLQSLKSLEIPHEIGKVEYFHSGNSGREIFHIQTAHGHYEAQKNIQAVLNHLNGTHGIDTVLVEGAWDQLDAELINFFPQDEALTRRANDILTREALVKGAELYLWDTRTQSRGIGIENKESYLENGEEFTKVLIQKRQTSAFLQKMQENIDRISSIYLNSELRSFINRIESYESGVVPFEKWIHELKKLASDHLDSSLEKSAFQIDWPMLVRIFTLDRLQSRLDVSAFESEKEQFLSSLRSLNIETKAPALVQNIETVLNGGFDQKLTDPETSQLFERMVQVLPESFDYDAYQNVTAFIGMMILTSELDAETLMNEVEKLQDMLAEELTHNQDEKKLVATLKSYRLLKKLFALELTPRDYDLILASSNIASMSSLYTANMSSSGLPRGSSDVDMDSRQKHSGMTGNLSPVSIIKALQNLNDESRFKNVSFEGLEEIEKLYQVALDFYEGAKERDSHMLKNIEDYFSNSLLNTHDSKRDQRIAVITGGFHAGPFTEHFTSAGDTYALIAPTIHDLDETGHQNYLKVAAKQTLPQLKQSTWETAFATSPAATVTFVDGESTVIMTLAESGIDWDGTQPSEKADSKLVVRAELRDTQAQFVSDRVDLKANGSVNTFDLGVTGSIQFVGPEWYQQMAEGNVFLVKEAEYLHVIGFKGSSAFNAEHFERDIRIWSIKTKNNKTVPKKVSEGIIEHSVWTDRGKPKELRAGDLEFVNQVYVREERGPTPSAYNFLFQIVPKSKKSGPVAVSLLSIKESKKVKKAMKAWIKADTAKVSPERARQAIQKTKETAGKVKEVVLQGAAAPLFEATRQELREDGMVEVDKNQAIAVLRELSEMEGLDAPILEGVLNLISAVQTDEASGLNQVAEQFQLWIERDLVNGEPREIMQGLLDSRSELRRYEIVSDADYRKFKEMQESKHYPEDLLKPLVWRVTASLRARQSQLTSFFSTPVATPLSVENAEPTLDTVSLHSARAIEILSAVIHQNLLEGESGLSKDFEIAVSLWTNVQDKWIKILNSSSPSAAQHLDASLRILNGLSEVGTKFLGVEQVQSIQKWGKSFYAQIQAALLARENADEAVKLYLNNALSVLTANPFAVPHQDYVQDEASSMISVPESPRDFITQVAGHALAKLSKNPSDASGEGWSETFYKEFADALPNTSGELSIVFDADIAHDLTIEGDTVYLNKRFTEVFADTAVEKASAQDLTTLQDLFFLLLVKSVAKVGQPTVLESVESGQAYESELIGLGAQLQAYYAMENTGNRNDKTRLQRLFTLLNQTYKDEEKRDTLGSGSLFHTLRALSVIDIHEENAIYSEARLRIFSKLISDGTARGSLVDDLGKREIEETFISGKHPFAHRIRGLVNRDLRHSLAGNIQVTQRLSKKDLFEHFMDIREGRRMDRDHVKPVDFDGQGESGFILPINDSYRVKFSFDATERLTMVTIEGQYGESSDAPDGWERPMSAKNMTLYHSVSYHQILPGSAKDEIVAVSVTEEGKVLIVVKDKGVLDFIRTKRNSDQNTISNDAMSGFFELNGKRIFFEYITQDEVGERAHSLKKHFEIQSQAELAAESRRPVEDGSAKGFLQRFFKRSEKRATAELEFSVNLTSESEVVEGANQFRQVFVSDFAAFLFAMDSHGDDGGTKIKDLFDGVSELEFFYVPVKGNKVKLVAVRSKDQSKVLLLEGAGLLVYRGEEYLDNGLLPHAGRDKTHLDLSRTLSVELEMSEDSTRMILSEARRSENRMSILKTALIAAGAVLFQTAFPTTSSAIDPRKRDIPVAPEAVENPFRQQYVDIMRLRKFAAMGATPFTLGPEGAVASVKGWRLNRELTMSYSGLKDMRESAAGFLMGIPDTVDLREYDYVQMELQGSKEGQVIVVEFKDAKGAKISEVSLTLSKERKKYLLRVPHMEDGDTGLELKPAGFTFLTRGDGTGLGRTFAGAKPGEGEGFLKLLGLRTSDKKVPGFVGGETNSLYAFNFPRRFSIGGRAVVDARQTHSNDGYQLRANRLDGGEDGKVSRAGWDFVFPEAEDMRGRVMEFDVEGSHEGTEVEVELKKAGDTEPTWSSSFKVEGKKGQRVRLVVPKDATATDVNSLVFSIQSDKKGKPKKGVQADQVDIELSRFSLSRKEIRSELRSSEKELAEIVHGAYSQKSLERAIATGTAWLRESDEGDPDVQEDRYRRFATAVGKFYLGGKDNLDKDGKPLPVAFAYDTRPNGRRYAIAMIETFAALGIPSVFFTTKDDGSPDQYVSTPVAMEETNLQVEGALKLGIHITASHNPVSPEDTPEGPAFYAGAKVLIAGAPGEAEAAAEVVKIANSSEVMEGYQKVDFGDAFNTGLVTIDEGVVEKSTDRLDNAFDFEALAQRIEGFKVVYTGLHGSTVGQAKGVLERLGVDYISLDEEPIEKLVERGEYAFEVNGERRGPDPTKTHNTSHLSDEEIKEKYPDRLIMLMDGDGDRLVVKYYDEETGRVFEINPNQLAAIFYYFLRTRLIEEAESKGETVDPQKVVRTATTSRIFDLLAEMFGDELIETPVGSANFAQYLYDLLVAAEESGHLFFNFDGNAFPDSATANMVMLFMVMGSDNFKEITKAKAGTFGSPHLFVDHIWDKVTEDQHKRGNTAFERLEHINELANTKEILKQGIDFDDLKKFVVEMRGEDSFQERLAAKVNASRVELEVAELTFDRGNKVDKNGVGLEFIEGAFVFPRNSGTEPKIRIYFEVAKSELVDEDGFLDKDKIEAQRAGIEAALLELYREVRAEELRAKSINVNLASAGFSEDASVYFHSSKEGFKISEASNGVIVFENNDGKKVSVKFIEHRGLSYFAVGNSAYEIRGDLDSLVIDLDRLNPISNPELLHFYGKGDTLSGISAKQLAVALPTDDWAAGEYVRLFPVSSSEFPALKSLITPEDSSKVVEDARDDISEFILPNEAEDLGDRLTNEDVEKILSDGNLAAFLSAIAIVGTHGDGMDYHWAQSEMLSPLFFYMKKHEDKFTKGELAAVASISNYLLTSYSGYDWNKWVEMKNKILSAQGEEGEAASSSPQTLFSKPVEPTRLGVENIEDWKVESVESIAVEAQNEKGEAVSLDEANKLIEEGGVVNIAFGGGSATTVKKALSGVMKEIAEERDISLETVKVSLNKLVHPALRVRTTAGDVRTISIMDTRVGALLGQSPDSHVVVITSVGGPDSGESDADIRESLPQSFKEEWAKGQVSIAIQRNGGVADPETGTLGTFEDGRVAAVAENHLHAFLGFLKDSGKVQHMIRNTSGIMSMGNGDNGMNVANPEMVQKFIDARKNGTPLATVAAGVKHAGDTKGGIFVKTTYVNRKTGEKHTQVELREISEFPTRGDHYDGVHVSKLGYEPEDHELIENILEKDGQEIGGLFNVAFYGNDLLLFVARILGVEVSQEAVLKAFSEITAQEWVDKVNELASKVPASTKPAKSAPSEDGQSSVTGRMTEQAVQDFIYNAMGLLANENGEAPVVDTIEIGRGDFLAYKGTFFKRDGDEVYDLIRNQEEYATAVASGKITIELGEGVQVAEVLPMESLRELGEAILQEALQETQSVDSPDVDAVGWLFPQGERLIQETEKVQPAISAAAQERILVNTGEEPISFKTEENGLFRVERDDSEKSVGLIPLELGVLIKGFVSGLARVANVQSPSVLINYDEGTEFDRSTAEFVASVLTAYGVTVYLQHSGYEFGSEVETDYMISVQSTAVQFLSGDAAPIQKGLLELVKSELEKPEVTKSFSRLGTERITQPPFNGVFFTQTERQERRQDSADFKNPYAVGDLVNVDSTLFNPNWVQTYGARVDAKVAAVDGPSITVQSLKGGGNATVYLPNNSFKVSPPTRSEKRDAVQNELRLSESGVTLDTLKKTSDVLTEQVLPFRIMSLLAERNVELAAALYEQVTGEKAVVGSLLTQVSRLIASQFGEDVALRLTDAGRLGSRGVVEGYKSDITDAPVVLDVEILRRMVVSDRPAVYQLLSEFKAIAEAAKKPVLTFIGSESEVQELLSEAGQTNRIFGKAGLTPLQRIELNDMISFDQFDRFFQVIEPDVAVGQDAESIVQGLMSEFDGAVATIYLESDLGSRFDRGVHVSFREELAEGKDFSWVTTYLTVNTKTAIDVTRGIENADEAYAVLQTIMNQVAGLGMRSQGRQFIVEFIAELTQFMIQEEALAVSA